VTTARLCRVLTMAVLAGLGTATSSCGSDAGSAPPAASAPTSASTGTATSPAPAVPSGPIGPGCDALPGEGPGSLAAMATQPVATAIGSSPLLTSLTQAVLAANLVDVLNGRQDVTVLAPVDTAFQAVDPAALSGLLGDLPRLTTVLTHQVIPGRLTPDQLVGEHTTLNGDSVTVSGSSTDLTVSADRTLAGAAPATVVCGNVPTANATLYLVDQVLAPATAG
jgi:uncharacterized surface protein with fasciclin (FAS1) repeats